MREPETTRARGWTEQAAPMTERTGDQVFAAAGYGVCATGLFVTGLAPFTDDLGPGQSALLLALFTALSLLGIRHRARGRRGRRRPPRSRHTYRT